MKNVKDILNVEENEIQLSERAVEIDVRTQAPEMREIVGALKDTMTAKDIVALAAPQIGYARRIFCIKFKEEIKTFINPIIPKAEGLELSRETSIVIPDKEYIRPRNNKIDLIYQRPMGKPESRQFIGLAAIIVQQMMDAIDGLLLSDVGLEILPEFDEATDDERAELIKAYCDSLDIRTKQLDEEIEKDPELKKLSDGIKYMESVWKGETKIEGLSE